MPYGSPFKMSPPTGAFRAPPPAIGGGMTLRGPGWSGPMPGASPIGGIARQAPIGGGMFGNISGMLSEEERRRRMMMGQRGFSPYSGALMDMLRAASAPGDMSRNVPMPFVDAPSVFPVGPGGRRYRPMPNDGMVTIDPIERQPISPGLANALNRMMF